MDFTGKRFDLHIHTFFSNDSLIDPRLLLKTAVLKGLAGLAITDHNFFGTHRLLKPVDMIVVPGMELRTSAGDMLTLFIQEPVYSKDPFEASDRVRSQDGVVIAAHPFGFPRLRGNIGEDVLRILDGVEVFNARNLLASQNARALKLARILGKAEVGGSDAHTLSEVGRAYTLADASSLEELHSSIKRRLTRAGGKLSLPTVHIASTAASLMHHVFKHRDDQL